MKCYKCKNNLVEQQGNLELSDFRIGKYTVKDITYSQCPNCGKLRFSLATAKTIEARQNKILAQLIGKLPVAEFIPAVEVADILGVSRQAIHKHRKIRRGFIYSIKIGGKLLYHKKSVELYKSEKQDGRFPFVSENKWFRAISGRTKKVVFVSPDKNWADGYVEEDVVNEIDYKRSA